MIYPFRKLLFSLIIVKKKKKKKKSDEGVDGEVIYSYTRKRCQYMLQGQFNEGISQEAIFLRRC